MIAIKTPQGWQLDELVCFDAVGEYCAYFREARGSRLLHGGSARSKRNGDGRAAGRLYYRSAAV